MQHGGLGHREPRATHGGHRAVDCAKQVLVQRRRRRRLTARRLRLVLGRLLPRRHEHLVRLVRHRLGCHRRHLIWQSDESGLDENVLGRRPRELRCRCCPSRGRRGGRRGEGGGRPLVATTPRQARGRGCGARGGRGGRSRRGVHGAAPVAAEDVLGEVGHGAPHCRPEARAQPVCRRVGRGHRGRGELRAQRRRLERRCRGVQRRVRRGEGGHICLDPHPLRRGLQRRGVVLRQQRRQ